ncbi:MAG: sulfotransferase domain-containing protein, partial [Anaerolineales bacterium]
LRKPVISRTPNESIFHCCVQKTGSQWIRRILEDRQLYRYHGLKPVAYRERPKSIPEASVPPVHRGKVHLHYYIDFPTYLRMPKPERYKTFYIFRDPRDIVVSWYFSVRNTHSASPGILRHRKVLRSLGRVEGMEYTILELQRYGLFAAMDSWAHADRHRRDVLLCRFEDLIADSATNLSAIFRHCEIEVPPHVLQQVIQRHSFASLTGGRRRGAEDLRSHLRKGVAGDWRNHFNPKLASIFELCAGDLTFLLGYGS